MSWQQIDMNRLDIPLKEVYSFMGYKDSEADAETRRAVEFLLRESYQFLRPQFKQDIDWVHHNTTVAWSATQPARTAGFARHFQSVI